MGLSEEGKNMLVRCFKTIALRGPENVVIKVWGLYFRRN